MRILLVDLQKIKALLNASIALKFYQVTAQNDSIKTMAISA